MAFLRRLFGGKKGDAYQTGIALVEQGRFAEAIPLLQAIYDGDQASPRGSLAGLYLRQALVNEGRRLLRDGDGEGAVRPLDAAAERWPDFPDLQFQTGAASAVAGHWDAALARAQAALRCNPDYCEARLLEAAALQATDRLREAATSLDHLVESGRRVDHQLVNELAQTGAFSPENLPSDLAERVRSLAVGDDAKRRLAEMVATCRAGRWDEALAGFAELSAEFPRYPDIRVRHAAALYHLGRLDAALAETDAALAINPRYRSAASLRGLVLAESGRLGEAHDYLADVVPELEGTAGRHEELFLAYLRAVLALLVGQRQSCRDLLAGWNDLPRQFARAELVLVACDDLDGLHAASMRRIDDLYNLWTSDAELAFLRAAMLLRERQWTAVEAALAQWPSGAQEAVDDRPLLLQARLDIARGHRPDIRETTDTTSASTVDPTAWRQLGVHARLLDGLPLEAMNEAQALIDADVADEETGRLLLVAAKAAGEQPVPDPTGCCGVPDSWADPWCQLLRSQDSGVRAQESVERHGRLRPEVVQWTWLSAGFWLEPVRRWVT